MKRMYLSAIILLGNVTNLCLAADNDKTYECYDRIKYQYSDWGKIHGQSNNFNMKEHRKTTTFANEMENCCLSLGKSYDNTPNSEGKYENTCIPERAN